MFASGFRVRTHSIFLTVAMMAALLIAPPATAADPVPGADFTLTILHNNDGESQLINAGSDLADYGGIARFKTLVDGLRADATANGNGVLMLSSGDNFLAGPEFNASIENGIPFYDALGMEAIGYDAVSLGNHDFDFGPDVLADFLSSYTSAPQYLNANLNFVGEPGLQAFVDSGVIAPSTVVTTAGEQIGIIGAVTPSLRSISSPRNVVIDFDVAGAIQTEVDALTAAGVNKIVLISHLQDITEDIALAAELTGVDVMIAGGGDELLANPGDPLVPGEEDDVFGAYPLTATGADGASIPVVTTPGEYKYLGRLSVGFDADGNVTGVGADSGPKVVDGTITPDAGVLASVVDPVVAAIATLDAAVIGTSEVDLDGTRNSVRNVEANEGSLLADALLWQARQLAADFGVNEPDVALQNGGGIRNNTVIPAGDITVLDTFDIAPFPNFVAVLEDIPRDQFRTILENAYSDLPGGGRFAQVAGFEVTYDITGTPMVTDDETGAVTQVGNRIVDVVLDDGTVIVEGGAVVAGDPITISTIDFLARGGDQYPYDGASFTTIGVSYQQALANFIVDGLGGTISAADYPEDGEGRITEVGFVPIEGPFTPIYDIQGSGDDSPLDGETVEVAGYVTGVFPDLGGFYLQDGTGDGDAATSDGIFVEAVNGVAVGDHAELRATVAESFGETRLVDVDGIEVEDTGGSVAPAEVSLPLAEGASLEAFEGMLVTFPNYLFVSDTFNLHRFGEAVLSEGGVLVNPTNIAAPGDPAIALAAANSARQIIIDDGSGDQFPDAVPYFGDDGTLRRGDAAKGITANLSFSFGAFKLQPTEDVSFERMNARPANPDDVGGNLTVASFNVLNFFSTIDDGDNGARGADSDAEKAAQLDKLVAAIGGLGADIIGIQEIENNGPVAIGELIDGLNAKYGAGTWAAAADPDYPGGLETTNAIKVGIIFKTASVTPIGGTEVSEDPVFGADRPPIAHTFMASGETFTVINNHFKSKSSRDAEGADLDQDDGQGAYNARRTAQAAALLDFVAELADSSGDPDVLVIGDFNSYPMEDPITTLEAGGLTNLVRENLTTEDSYSLVFFGAQGLLDGAFVTDSLADSVTGIDLWHINADEPRVLQYNDDVVDPAERSSDFNQPVSQPDVYSSSDHDPLIVGLQLGSDSPITLGFSKANDRSAPDLLDGATVSGKVWASVLPLDPGLGFTTVDFYLDGEHARTEYLAPYDFAGGLLTMATAWNSTDVADGEHTMKAVGNLPDGSTIEASATFTVDNAPEAADFAMSVSESAYRTDAVPLEGAVLRGDVYPFVDPLFPEGFESFGTVSFYLDGEHFHTEYLAPYDFVSGGTEKANESWDTTSVEDGPHAITFKAIRDGAGPVMGTVTFSVSNDTEPPPPPPPPPPEAIRFATFNASLNRSNAGDLVADLSTPDNEQAKVIAEIIQRARPDVLLVNEFDYDADGEGARLFQENYLSVSQNGADPIDYGYAFSAPSNTGVPSGLDLDNSGDVGGPGDAFGFGFFEGQFGMQVYSQYPIDFANVRTFQSYLWADLPGALLPIDPATGEGWYSEEELESVRLSSKSHWDVPIVVGDGVVNFLVSHPTPPVFDGLEDRNGTRNSDEIRFWRDYVDGAPFFYDDNGVEGGWDGDYFVIAGDLNSDPLDGDSLFGSIQQLLDLPRVNTSTTPSSLGAVEQDGLQAGANLAHLSDPAYDTADFNDNPAPGNLRADYVLPSNNLAIADSGVFWPESTDPLFPLVGTFPFPSSDHRMVWVDLLPGDEELADSVGPPDDEVWAFDVTIENLSDGQPFTPALIVAHDPAISAWTVGEVAPLGIQELAENGNGTPLAGFFTSRLSQVSDGRFGSGPLVPAADPGGSGFPSSETLPLHAREGYVISFGSMLICTNDGFVGLNGAALPDEGETVVYDLFAYDAGTETNTEDFADMVPPCQGLIGVSSEDPGTGETDPGLSEGGVIAAHAGIVGGNDLDPAVHGWTDPIGRVTITHGPPPPPPEPLAFLVADFGRGSTEVPGPGDPTALSAAFIDVFEGSDETHEVCFFVNTSVQDPTGAHIHRGVAGESGPVVVDTGFDADSWTQDEFFVTDRSADGCVDVDRELALEISANPGNFYFNVHSVTYPAGATREQLLDAAGLSEFPRAFTAAPLLGSNEVPGPGDPDTGRGFVDFFQPVTDNGEWCYQSTIFRVGEITSGHIHTGAAGESGGPVVNLEMGSRWPAVLHPSGQGWIINGCVPVPADVQSQIAANPGGFYANLHNVEFPGGAGRAQLVAGKSEVIRLAELAPPDAAEPDVGGFSNMALFPSQGLLCWDTPMYGIGEPTGMSITDAGGVVVSFDLMTHPFLADVVDPFVEYTSFGCQAVDSETIDAIVANPSAFTFEVNTATGAPALTGLIFDPAVGPQPPPPPPAGPNIVDSIVKAPIVPDGDVAGAITDFVINLDRSLDPLVDGRSLAAGDTIRITLPDDFINNGFDTGAPGAPNCVPGPCNVGVLLQGWPQHPIAPPAAKYSLAMEGTHTVVYTALEDLGPAGAGNPGIKQMHLILLGFTNPGAGDYEIMVEAQTGPGGAVETGTGILTIRPAIVPSINVTSVFNEGTPNTIYQETETGTPTPFAYDFLLWDAVGAPMTGVTLDGSVLMGDGARVGEVTITAPDGATGQAVAVGAPSAEITAPVLGVPTARLTAQFTAGSVLGAYSVTFSLDGGTAVTMYVTATAVVEG